jgi:hypothetical protein
MLEPSIKTRRGKGLWGREARARREEEWRRCRSKFSVPTIHRQVEPDLAVGRKAVIRAQALGCESMPRGFILLYSARRNPDSPTRRV